MPIYEYKCAKCKKHHEIMQKITDKPLTICPSCGGTMNKMISSTSFVLKGSGWYATDYAGKGKKDAVEKTEKKEKTETSAKKEPKSEKKASSDPKK
jgi:putative FmdB family regulatory protein